MSKSFLDLEKDYIAHSRSLHKDGGAPLKAFRDLVQAAGTDRAWSHKQKELIALATRSRSVARAASSSTPARA